MLTGAAPRKQVFKSGKAGKKPKINKGQAAFCC
jgi:hypothetical protein